MPATDEVMLYVIASHDPIPDLQAEVESVQGGAVIDEAYIGNLMLSARQSGGGTVSIADVYAGKGTLLTDKDKIDTNATIVCYHAPPSLMSCTISLTISGKAACMKIGASPLSP